MLTAKQKDLLIFIHERVERTGVPRVMTRGWVEKCGTQASKPQITVSL